VDFKKIQDYITRNNLTVIEDSDKTGFYYQILTPGTGELYQNTDSVLYNGIVKSLENGTTYLTTSTNGNLGTYVGYTNSLNGASIPAIRKVINQLRPGGTARIFLPSYLAFGKNGISNIPSNENIDLYINTYPEKVQWQLDDRLIKEFIAKNSLTMEKDPSRVYYAVSTPGTGADAITESSSITVNYTGRYLDGTVFDSSTDGTYVSVLAGLIPGWIKAIPGRVTKGGKIRLLIPSDLAYGPNPTNGITANACLDFDIEIVDVTN